MTGLKMLHLTVTLLVLFPMVARLQPCAEADIIFYRLELSVPFEYDDWRKFRNTLTGKAIISISTKNQSYQTWSLLLHRLLKVNRVTDSSGKELHFQQQVVNVDGWETFQLNHILVGTGNSLQDTVTLMIDYSGYLDGYEETGMLYVKEALDPAFTIIRSESFSYPQMMEPTEKAMMTRWRGADDFQQEVKIALPHGFVPAQGIRGLVPSREDDRNIWRWNTSGRSFVIPIARYQVVDHEGYRIYYLTDDAAGARRIASGIEKVSSLYMQWMGPLLSAPDLSVVEIPDDYGSQVIMPMIIQTAAAFKDARSMGELYHEIAHFWNVRDTEVNSPRWNEGQAMYLQYLAFDSLNERGSLMSALNGRLTRVKKYFEENPEYIAMADYGMKGVTSVLSYSAGPLFFYVLEGVMGREPLLETLGRFYRAHDKTGSTVKDFANYMIKADPRCKLVFDDWFYGTAYIDDIKKANDAKALIVMN